MTTPDSHQEASEQIRLERLLRPLAARKRLVILFPLAITAATVSLSLMRERKFAAELTLTTVTAGRSGSLTQSFPASLLTGMSVGLQPTPTLITRLARSRNVISEIARKPIPSRSESVVEAVDPDLGPDDPDYKVYQALSRIIGISHDRETGLVTLSVTSADSTVARLVATELVAGVTEAFQRAAQAQASQMRRAQELRVDSASRRLRHAERELVAFLAQNRAIAPHSFAAVERDRRIREVTVAQEVYMQAVTERESAIAKELEETPAVVVVDPIPRELVPVARGTIVKGLLAAVASLLLVVTWIVATDLFGWRERGARTDSPGSGDGAVRRRQSEVEVPAIRSAGSD